jgi:para-nitrobenzyl esterase
VDIDAVVAGGVVRGKVEDALAVFRGIPYASLEQRLWAPGPVHRWEGARPATRFGPPPPQAGLSGGAQGRWPEADWLSLNVWSPETEGSLPVMVWIQGGGYLFGTSGLPEYDGACLARSGVVLVTFNYRVGFEGFGLVEGHPVNRGLLDQVAALKWVHQHIAAFGGDPDRVTVFGQSAGAGSVAALLTMPRARGLFHGAVAQSVPGAYLTPALAGDVARVLAARSGLRTSDLATLAPTTLAHVAASALTSIGDHAGRWGRAAHAGILFAPVVDGDTLPTTPWEGLSGTVPLLVGHTRHEQRLLTFLSGQLGQVTSLQAEQAAEIFAPDPAAYRALFPDPEELYDVVRSDWLFRMPSVHLAEAQRRAGGTAYLYELTWPAPAMDGALGACHGLDVPLVFGNLGAGQTAMLLGEITAETAALSEQMRGAWTSFAITGNPGWQAYDDTAPTRLFDTDPDVVRYPEHVSRQLCPDHPRLLDLSADSE